MDTQELVKKLNEWPEIKSKIIDLIGIAEKENLKLADEAELTVKNSLDGMGKDILTKWAQIREAVENKKFSQEASKHRKKNSIGIHSTEK